MAHDRLTDLHVKERRASIGATDAEDIWRPQLLQCQQEHGPAKDGSSAAPEPACVVGTFLMLQLGACRLEGHASVKCNGVAARLKPIVGINPQSLPRYISQLDTTVVWQKAA